MSYILQYRASVRRELGRLDKAILKRVDTAIQKLADHPRPAGCVKLSGTLSLWRIRVGDYRVVYEIRDQELIVIIVTVAHRREVYRGL
jgi:mRNA interferase RelE/StbE